MPENHEVWKVFELIHSQARTAGLGGFISFDFSALPFILTTLFIPKSQWIFVVEKLAIIQQKAQQYWNEKKDAASN
jgi:hypothetical protein